MLISDCELIVVKSERKPQRITERTTLCSHPKDKFWGLFHLLVVVVVVVVHAMLLWLLNHLKSGTAGLEPEHFDISEVRSLCEREIIS